MLAARARSNRSSRSALSRFSALARESRTARRRQPGSRAPGSCTTRRSCWRTERPPSAAGRAPCAALRKSAGLPPRGAIRALRVVRKSRTSARLSTATSRMATSRPCPPRRSSPRPCPRCTPSLWPTACTACYGPRCPVSYRTHRCSSTIGTEVSAGIPQASPPTPPGDRGPSCRGSSTWCPCSRRRGC